MRIELTRHCERSEAIQDGVQCVEAELDCFVASLLAMTGAPRNDGDPTASLRAQRSNPAGSPGVEAELDCFVASLLAMTGAPPRHCERSEAIQQARQASRQNWIASSLRSSQ
jgi:hypothetical protein